MEHRDLEQIQREGIFENREMGIPYYDGLEQWEQQELTGVIRLLWRQTFLLEHKYDKKTGRFQYNPDFRLCSRHLEFIRRYFAVSGVELKEDTQLGLIYIQGEYVAGDKLPRLATLYVLILKLIYDEQMERASSSVSVYTSLGEIHEKLGNCHLLKRQPSPTEIRRAIALLKKYQLIELLELSEDFKGEDRILIYPTVCAVLMGDDVRALLAAFDDEEKEEEANGDQDSQN